MLIKCPECGREVSDSAPACLGCGHPLQAVQTSPMPSAPTAPSAAQPSMAGSFLMGPLGGLLRLVGIGAILLSLLGFVLHGPTAPLFLILGVALVVGGSYARYVSRHTVRVSGPR
jgi:hypothetical protein